MVLACRIDRRWSMNGCHLKFMMVVASDYFLKGFGAVVIVDVGVRQICEDLVHVPWTDYHWLRT